MKDMISVLYMSSAKQPFSEQDLEALLTSSRTNNERLGITGMLLYKDINFLQLLEGPEEAVDALMKKIAADARHCGMVTLLRETIDDRRFGEWSMGFVNANHAKKMPEGFSEIMNTFEPTVFFKNPTLAQKVLAGFRDAL